MLWVHRGPSASSFGTPFIPTAGAPGEFMVAVAAAPTREDFASMLEESFHKGNLEEGSVIFVSVVLKRDNWIEKLVGMPRRGQWSGLCFAIADDAGDHEIRIVKHRSERMAERIAQLAAFVDRARALRRCVAGNTSRKRKLKK